MTIPVHRFASLTVLCAMAFSAPAAADPAAAVPSRPPAAAPENIAAVPGNAKVTIVWSPVPGAEGYRIYRGANGAWTNAPIGSTTATSHTSYGLENGTMYSFTVAAYTSAGTGPLSLAVNAMPLAPPQAVTMAAGDRRVTLNWQPSAGATSYTIYRRLEGEPEFTELTTGVAAPPFVDPGLANGTRHFYQLRAETAATQSELSAKVSAIPGPRPPAAIAMPAAPLPPVTSATLAAYDHCDARPAHRAGMFRRLWRTLLGRQ